MFRSVHTCRLFVAFFGLLVSGMIFTSLQSMPVQAAEKTKPIDLSTAIVQVAKQNLPSVVYIEVTESREVTNPFKTA